MVMMVRQAQLDHKGHKAHLEKKEDLDLRDQMERLDSL